MTQTPNTLPSDIQPLVMSLEDFLKSPQVTTALVTALVDLLVLAVPSLQPFRDQLLTVFTALGLALIATLTAQTHSAAKVAVAQHQAEAAKAVAAAQTASASDGDTKPMPPVQGGRYTRSSLN